MKEYNDASSKELLLKAQNGDSSAVSALVEKNMGLVWSVVRRFTNRGTEADDLFQIGSIGLIKAIKNFNTSFDVCFSTYAVPMIAGEIKRFLRDDGPVKVSRTIKELYSKARNMKDTMQRELGREPSVGELAKRLQVEPEELALALDSNQVPESLYSVVNENDSSPIYLIDRLAQNAGNGEESSENGERLFDHILDKLTVKKAIQALNPEEQQIITLRYYHEMTQARIADIMGISQVQVSRLEKRILKKMRELI